jgi:hypothetical protein
MTSQLCEGSVSATRARCGHRRADDARCDYGQLRDPNGRRVGVAAAMAGQDLHIDPTRSQAEQLDEIVSECLESNSAEFTWIQSIAEEFRIHDDADQFAAGLDLFPGAALSGAGAADSARDGRTAGRL